ncbi:hypothetical protein AXW83_15435 [Bosea sp. PAMC 26642]|nr:hypothetical protein AXW83_15435 [Bosea sp. PAMC 26642]
MRRHWPGFAPPRWPGIRPPLTDSGNTGGVFREVGPRGGERDNYTTVPDHTRLPPTTTLGSTWVPVKRTPDSKR